MIYRLGKYMYKDGDIYKTWGPFRKKIIEGPFNYKQGVVQVNKLNGIPEGV